MALCVLVQIGLFLLGPAAAAAIGFEFGLIPARFVAAAAGKADAISAVVTLFTHALLHWSLLHLAMNMLMLGFLGRDVEWRLGAGGLLLLFWAGVLAGAVLEIALNPIAMTEGRGASGGVAAVLAGFAMLFGNTRVASRRVLGLLIPGRWLTALWYAGAWIGVQLLSALAFNSAMNSIAIGAHIGGFLAGMALAGPLARRRPLVGE